MVKSLEQNSTLTSMALDLLIPKCCVGCGRVGNYICRRCLRTKLKPYYVQHCHVCRHESRTGMVHQDCREHTHLDGVIVGYVYNSLAEKLMLLVKYQFYYAVINDVAKLVAASLRESPEVTGACLTYVPASAYRQKWRGFNQSQLLASDIARIIGFNCADLLTRSQFTHSQLGQGRMSRLGNLRQAFAINVKAKLPEAVIVVDDVMTTGSTLEQCARVLKQAGVKRVYGLVFARGWYLPES